MQDNVNNMHHKTFFTVENMIKINHNFNDGETKILLKAQSLQTVKLPLKFGLEAIMLKIGS